MKHKISDVNKFKEDILKQTVADWELQAQSMEAQLQAEVDSASDRPQYGSSFSKKELADQAARLALSNLKTPLNELKSIIEKPFPRQEDDVIRDFTLFDLNVASAGNNKTTTFLVLPMRSLGKARPNIKLGDIAIVLTNRQHPWFGHKLNDRKRVPSEDIYSEPHMGHIVMTGEKTKAMTVEVTWIYK